MAGTEGAQKQAGQGAVTDEGPNSCAGGHSAITGHEAQQLQRANAWGCKLSYSLRPLTVPDQLGSLVDFVRGGWLHGASSRPESQRAGDRNWLQESVDTPAMLVELCADNRRLATFLRSTHQVCETHGDIATASLIENWMDETERRIWFLAETTTEV